KEDANEVHRAFYNETFGPKVTMLEKRLEHSAFDEHRAGLNHLIRMLRKLTSQRNNIIHGETFDITRRIETKVFRVGFTRKNLTPWKDFNLEGTEVSMPVLLIILTLIVWVGPAAAQDSQGRDRMPGDSP